MRSGFRDFAIARLRDLFLLMVLVVVAGCGASGSDVAEAPAPAPQPAAPPPDPRVAEMQVLLAELLDRIEVLNARLQRLESGAAPPAAPAPTSTNPTRSATATSRPQPLTAAAMAEKYRTALTMYGKGQLDGSRRLFQEVFDADPQGELADNALYWIAETYFVTAKYAEAMNVYRRILKDYTEENKAPDAMLKMGLAYVKLGDLALARSTFEQVIQKYPYSTPAAAAKLEIKRIKY